MEPGENIYLDHNATTPLHPEVREAMEPFLGSRFGNALCRAILRCSWMMPYMSASAVGGQPGT